MINNDGYNLKKADSKNELSDFHSSSSSLAGSNNNANINRTNSTFNNPNKFSGNSMENINNTAPNNNTKVYKPNTANNSEGLKKKNIELNKILFFILFHVLLIIFSLFFIIT